MQQPDSRGWRRPTRGELLAGPGRRDALLARVVDDRGLIVAEGLLIGYDPTAGTVALLGPNHRPGATVRTLAARPDQLWVLD